MKNKFLFCFVAAFGLAGCRMEHDPETKRINQSNANAPEFIVDTPRGKLYRINIDRGQSNDDRVYWFENSDGVSINTTIKSGKTYHTETIMVDGIEYIRKN